MSRKKYWFLNALWQLAMYGMLLAFHQYESYVFDYSWHYRAERMWVFCALIALVHSVMYYVLLEGINCFPRKKK
ncbi:hypothetical protein DFQ50_108312 [Pseudocitrobacter faecalis]|uniref:Uncharacterized protein n=1 Tax=Pseudocitrobacter faecalis TaxID=1398493 RepID=A0ABX9FS77_9ENTR|nr:hypothetical protein DFQ50_108312 [Pseudocitrobacter faecalis]